MTHSCSLRSHLSELDSTKAHTSSLARFHTPQYSLALEQILQAQQTLLPL